MINQQKKELLLLLEEEIVITDVFDLTLKSCLKIAKGKDNDEGNDDNSEAHQVLLYEGT